MAPVIVPDAIGTACLVVRKVAAARAEVGDIRPAVTAGSLFKMLGEVSSCWTGSDSGLHFPESNRDFDRRLSLIPKLT